MENITVVVRLKSALSNAELRAGRALPHGGFRFELHQDGVLASIGDQSVVVPWSDIQHGRANPFPAYMDDLLDRADPYIKATP